MEQQIVPRALSEVIALAVETVVLERRGTSMIPYNFLNFLHGSNFQTTNSRENPKEPDNPAKLR